MRCMFRRVAVRLVFFEKPLTLACLESSVVQPVYLPVSQTAGNKKAKHLLWNTLRQLVDKEERD